LPKRVFLRAAIKNLNIEYKVYICLPSISKKLCWNRFQILYACVSLLFHFPLKGKENWKSLSLVQFIKICY